MAEHSKPKKTQEVETVLGRSTPQKKLTVPEIALKYTIILCSLRLNTIYVSVMRDQLKEEVTKLQNTRSPIEKARDEQ